MQTIVKIFIALIFSHLSVSETPREKNSDDKVQTAISIEINSCATTDKILLDHLS